VAEFFEAQGFSNVKVLAGGVNAWINAGYPLHEM
jgi:rhodanese-related sulfurtransferase